MTTQRAIQSPLTEESSVVVLGYADMVAGNDNAADPSQGVRTSPYAIPLLAFTGGFVIAGVLALLERVVAHAV